MRHIICFGNPLHGDDGVGYAVYQRLSTLPIPDTTRLFDAGTPGLNALALFAHCDDAIIVDAIAPAGHPGRLHKLLPTQITAENSIPGHGQGVAYLLQALSSLDEQTPRIQILGVEAYSVEPFNLKLSEPVSRAVDDVVASLLPYFGNQ